MTTASTLPCVSQMQPADAFMELGSRDSGYRKDLELSCYFDAMSAFHLYINIMANAWGNSLLSCLILPLRNPQVLEKFATMSSKGKDSDPLVKECKLPLRTDYKTVILIQVCTILTLSF